MHIKSSLINRLGQKLDLEYRDADSVQDLGDRKPTHVHAFCFFRDKIVLVFHSRVAWVPPGGGIEPGESVEEAVVREVKEETNMKVISQKLIGYQDVFEPTRIVTQTRSVCIVEPYGDFISDPDGDITEIKLIDPNDYKQYFDWQVVGDHIMKRALKLVIELQHENKME